MYKYSITILLIVGLGFSYGVRPAFDFGLKRMNMDISNEFVDINEDYLAFSIGTSVPYSKIVGLYVEIAAITFYDDDDITNYNIGGGGLSSWFTYSGFGGKIGLIEMIPMKAISPFLKQYIMIDKWSIGEYNESFYTLGFNAGLEFLSTSYVSPVFEVGIGFGDLNNMNTFCYGFAFSIRFSWEK